MSEDRKYILVVGSDVIMPKLFYLGPMFREAGIDFAVYTHDHSTEGANYAKQHNAVVFRGPRHSRSLLRVVRDWLTLRRTLKRNRFLWVEFYFTYHPLPLLGYLWLIKYRGLPIVAWFRGELYYWGKMGVLHRYFIKQLIGAAAIVILKEKYMRGVLEENGLLQEEKTCEIHNAVDLPNCAPKALSEAIVPRLLFLNMFKPWRRAEFILEVARRLRTIRNQFHIDIVGDKAAYGILVEETNRLRSRISAYGLDANVSIHPFTSCPTTYYQRSHIFLLPADLVFCNYALLEAMSYGMVPYVSNVDHGYIQIITDDVSGYGLPLDADGWASKIHGVLSDPQKYAMLSANARNTVRQHFSARANYQYYAEALRRRGILHDIGAPEDSPEVGHSQQECSQ